MKIGFLGIQCDNPNLGVAALAYAGVNLVHQAAPPEAEFVLFSSDSPTGISRMQQELGMESRSIRAVPFRHRNPRRMLKSGKEIAGCSMVFDFTGGDSFSDIYGSSRLGQMLLHQQMALLTRTPLIMAPQTFGPIDHRWLRAWARHVLRGAVMVFARDEQSQSFAESLAGRQAILTTDVAVTLPWRPADEHPGTNRVGFNVSGLLWAGGYTKDNQFGLRSEYPRYCREVLAGLLESGWQVDLIPHVLGNGTADGEGETSAALELQREFPDVHVAPRFESPVAAKSYISGVDVFIGARMHATIAAFTSGVPTVAVAYSRKFEGLYRGLGYDVVVDLTALELDEAVGKTLAEVDQANRLRQRVRAGNSQAAQKIAEFSDRLAALMADL